jgi:hypothetical protein
VRRDERLTPFFEFLDERSEMRGGGTREGVVLIPQGFPNYQHPNASTAAGKKLRRTGSVTILNYIPGNPTIDPVSCGGDTGHSCSPRLPLLIRAH